MHTCIIFLTKKRFFLLIQANRLQQDVKGTHRSTRSMVSDWKILVALTMNVIYISRCAYK